MLLITGARGNLKLLDIDNIEIVLSTFPVPEGLHVLSPRELEAVEYNLVPKVIGQHDRELGLFVTRNARKLACVEIDTAQSRIQIWDDGVGKQPDLFKHA